MRIHRAREPQLQAGKLRLHGTDNRVDLLVPGELSQRVDVAAVLRPDLPDEIAPGRSTTNQPESAGSCASGGSGAGSRSWTWPAVGRLRARLSR
jgi:hypothetical protein